MPEKWLNWTKTLPWSYVQLITFSESRSNNSQHWQLLSATWGRLKIMECNVWGNKSYIKKTKRTSTLTWGMHFDNLMYSILKSDVWEKHQWWTQKAPFYKEFENKTFGERRVGSRYLVLTHCFPVIFKSSKGVPHECRLKLGLERRLKWRTWVVSFQAALLSKFWSWGLPNQEKHTFLTAKHSHFEATAVVLFIFREFCIEALWL